MKKIKSICIAVVTLLLALFTLSSCMVIQSQRMEKVKGTYHLTSYTRTDGKTNETTNYLEKYGWNVYLVVTGESKGYYVFSDNQTQPYSREVFMRYVYDEEKKSRVANVEYSYDGRDYEEFGVTSGGLNFSRPRIYISDILNSDGYNKSWERVDKATDLSYVKQTFSNLKEYTFDSYNTEGIYSLDSYNWESYSEEALENPYHYYFISIDTTSKKATVAYLKKDGSEAVRETKDITLLDGWRNFKTGDIEWTKDELYSGIDKYYYTVIAGEPAIKQTIVRIRQDILETTLDSLIEENTPAPSITE